MLKTCPTSSVLELVHLEKFLATKNLKQQDMLQEAQCISEEGCKKVWVVLSAIGLPEKEFWWWVLGPACMAS